MKRLRYFGFILAAVALAVLGLEIYKSWPNLVSLWFEADKWLLIIILGLQLVSLLINAIVSDVLLKLAGHKVGVKDNFKVALINEFGDKSMPIAGGTITSYLFYSRLGITLDSIIFIQTIWVGLLLTFYTLAFVISAGLVQASYLTLVPKITLTAIPIALIIGFFAYEYLKNKEFVKRLFIKKNILSFFSHQRAAAEVIFLGAVYFLIDIVMLYVSFTAFGYSSSLVILTFGFIVSRLVAMFVPVPGGLGVSEAAFIVVYGAMGVPTHIAILGSLLYRIISHWIWVPFGLYFSLKGRD